MISSNSHHSGNIDFANLNAEQSYGRWAAYSQNFFLAQRIEMGVLPTLYAAIASDVRGGDYVGPDGFIEMRGYPKRVRANDRTHDKAVASKLWAKSETLAGVQYDILEPQRG